MINSIQWGYQGSTDSQATINKVNEATNNNDEAQAYQSSKCRTTNVPVQITQAASDMGGCLPSTLCPHLFPLFKDHSGFYQVLGAPLINPDVGKIFRKSVTKYIRFVELRKNRLSKTFF